MEETFQLRWGILVNCPTIDVIYIATPHSHHFQNAMLALEAGKHVLCEKNFTVNAGQAKKLSTVAEKKQRFLMEGLWTRFLPVSVEVRQFLQAGAIGTVTRVFADNGLGMDPYSDFLPGDLMVVKELAGGALLDLGVYSIHWVLQAMPKTNRRPIQILSTTTEYAVSGVDETTTILMRFAPSTADGPEIQATASASLRAITDPDGETAAVRIQGDQGETQIYGWPWCPSRLRVIRRGPGMNNRGTINRQDRPSTRRSIWTLLRGGRSCTLHLPRSSRESRDALAREHDSNGDHGYSAAGE
ncbi:oxidoreductase domain protein [Aspergillus oryzae]|uniref:D-xylose 1-dehydrogenase (NADP(+), D-xylono-1,5-lactone-forming) n=1 Tax=Aspergillus oryzae TaxID=5062 RepID=A0A1S9DDF2_ASPOZ|nr:oxidoreductase domain protein [Aspergillus oryzae]